VTLVKAGVITSTTITDSLGGYKFCGLTGGDYVVTETNPAGYIDVSDVSGSPVDSSIAATLVPGNSETGLDFVDEKLKTVSGKVLEDTNNDNKGEDPISGVVIEIYTQAGVLVDSTVTDSTGSYSFLVPPGLYTLREITPPGFVDVVDSDGGDPNNILNVNVSSADSLETFFIDELPTLAPTLSPTLAPTIIKTIAPTSSPTAAPTKNPTLAPTSDPTMAPTKSPTNAPTPVPLACISGKVTEDTNSDDKGDAPISGVTVTLKSPSGVTIASTVTDSSGFYKFCDLPEGSYVVMQTNLPTYSDVTDAMGSPTDNVIAVELIGGVDVTGRDFVDERFGSITGSVTQDTTGDDIGDAPLAGVTLTVFDSDGKVVATTVTDSAGKYVLPALPNGVYTVVQTNLPGYIDVSDGQGNPLDSTVTVTVVGGSAPAFNFVDRRPTASPTLAY
jgi:hypothetical protein